MISHSYRHCAVELDALPARIGQIRRIVSAQLRHWQLDPLIDRAALGVTELLSNVHRHAQPDKTCAVDMVLRGGLLTVSVRDHDPRLPEVRQADPLETGGRGLALVAAMSQAWGVRPWDGAGTGPRTGTPGKLVWFTLTTAAGPDPAGPPIVLHTETVPVGEAVRTEPAVPEALPA
ncbi:ATP-binding protein [Streptomyces sp. NPDC097619]|uniref:ATP-binding protein n=1 Tax=Streptomyces sp. NPDC097619 TaxID=3157228 RepID=UPI00331B7BBC